MNGKKIMRACKMLAIGLALALGYAACSGEGSSGSTGTTNNPPPPASLTIGGAPATVTYVASAQAESTAQNIPLNVTAPGNYQCTAHAQQGAQSLDAQMAILQGPTELTRDSDSGEGVDAQIVRQLTPGQYTVRVWEWMGRAASINVTCIPAPAVVATPLTLGAPATVNTVAGDGAGSRQELALTIPTAGRYRCDASAPGLDAQMAIAQNGTDIAQDSDSGGNFNAQIIRDFTPGAYIVRVWEWQNRAAPITVRCAPDAPAPVAGATAITLGTPATVPVAAVDGPAGQAVLDLVITTAGNYRCHAHADDNGTGRDAQMAILQAGTELQQDSDSGGNFDAQITRQLTPGAYQVRVWEWLHRAANITVTCAPFAG